MSENPVIPKSRYPEITMTMTMTRNDNDDDDDDGNNNEITK